MYRHKEQHIID